jgi:hypothetical protein
MVSSTWKMVNEDYYKLPFVNFMAWPQHNEDIPSMVTRLTTQRMPMEAIIN